MAGALNKVQLIGNITTNPEVKETPNGQKVASLSIATNRTWKDASWVKQEAVDFHNIVVWGSLAEIIEKYTSKGKKIYVEWRLQTRSWDADDGSKKYKTEIVAENIILLGTKDETKKEEVQDDAPEFKTGSYGKVKQEEEISLDSIPF